MPKSTPCSVCGKLGAKQCGGCGTAAYCSGGECQKVDWRKGHRDVCKQRQLEAAAQQRSRSQSVEAVGGAAAAVSAAGAPRGGRGGVATAAAGGGVDDRRDDDDVPPEEQCPICLDRRDDYETEQAPGGMCWHCRLSIVRAPGFQHQLGC